MDVESLDRILKERGVQIEKSKLAAVLNDASFSSWARLHLTPATLLSPDELATYVTCLSLSHGPPSPFLLSPPSVIAHPSIKPGPPLARHSDSDLPKTSFTALSGSGGLKGLGAAEADDQPLPRDEAELRRAIREIDRSTEAIARQTETLRQQQEALARFARGRINDEVKRDEAQAARGHGVAVEMREMRAAVCNSTCHFLPPPLLLPVNFLLCCRACPCLPCLLGISSRVANRASCHSVWGRQYIRGLAHFR